MLSYILYIYIDIERARGDMKTIKMDQSVTIVSEMIDERFFSLIHSLSCLQNPGGPTLHSLM